MEAVYTYSLFVFRKIYNYYNEREVKYMKINIEATKDILAKSVIPAMSVGIAILSAWSNNRIRDQLINKEVAKQVNLYLKSHARES